MRRAAITAPDTKLLAAEDLLQRLEASLDEFRRALAEFPADAEGFLWIPNDRVKWPNLWAHHVQAASLHLRIAQTETDIATQKARIERLRAEIAGAAA